MQIAIIGLGRMGANITRRLLRANHHCVVFDVNQDSMKPLVQAEAQGAKSIEHLVGTLSPPRVVWLMLPSAIVDKTIDELTHHLHPDDVIVDGGNRAVALKPKGIHYVDVGTSGGTWGLGRGYYLMIGGEKQVVRGLDPIFRALAPPMASAVRTADREKRPTTAEHGYLHCGASGTGHFVKMVHNGIEDGIMAAYAEAFNILHPELSEFEGRVSDSGEGRWTLKAAIDEGVPANALSSALFGRFTSRGATNFADKLLSAMRHEFGGHTERSPNKKTAAQR